MSFSARDAWRIFLSHPVFRVALHDVRHPHGDELCADALALEFLDGELAQAAGKSGVLAAAQREEKSEAPLLTR